MALTSELTTFTLDNMGRFLCNSLEEALHSTGTDVGLGKPPADARPFDVIIVGGGTFGSLFAQHLLFTDRTNSRRILVVDRGPFVIPEHVQNLPFLGVGLPDWVRPWQQRFSGNSPGLRMCIGGRSLEWGGWSPEPLDAELAVDWPATVVADLRGPINLEGQPAPGYYQQAADQLGVEETNDFIYGDLHAALRQQLRNGLAAMPANSVAANLALADVPDHPKVRFAPNPPTNAELRALLGLNGAAGKPRQELLELLRLEAPLAVEARTDPGQFPSNKFSALPLLVNASRTAATESYPYDQHKRLIVLPSWHVQELVTQTLPNNEVTVTGVRVVQGWAGQVSRSVVIPLADDGIAVIALGAVESTRLALNTFKDSLSGRAAQRMGQNLQAHLRSNLTIRVLRTSIKGLPPVPSSMQVSALFVKGKANLGGRNRHFHLQITASGLTASGRDSEAELFKKVPDIDNIDRLRRSDDTHIVITLRGIGEMSPHNPDSTVTLFGGSLDFERSQALVSLGDAKAFAEGTLANVSAETQLDAQVWERMDQLADEVALIFGAGKGFEILADNGGVVEVPAGASAADLQKLHPHTRRRDGLGTTHHECGTLWIGDDVATSVTDTFGRIHDTTNCFCVGPMLYPSSGSPNPMLSGAALARRTGDYLSRRLPARPSPSLLNAPARFQGDGPGWQVLFDGSVNSYKNWIAVGPRSGASNEPPCGFRYIDGQIVTVGAGDFALLFHPQSFSDFILKLQFRIFVATANSGVFLRVRDPRKSLPQEIARRAADDLRTFNNLAWTAVHSGFEVQIDDRASGDPRVDFYGIKPEPPGLMKNRTGAIYKIPAGDVIPNTGLLDRQDQQYQPGPTLQPLPWRDPTGWYEFEIKVQEDTYEVWLGHADSPKTRTTRFTNNDALRGVPASRDPESGFIGLQAHSQSRVAFRHIQVQPLA